MTYELYIIRDSKNNIVYVGITKDTKGFQKRFREHQKCARCNEDHTLLHNKMYEEGIENFSIECIEKGIPEHTASQLEEHYITKFDTYYLNGKGYNMTRGGHGCVGYMFTDDVKKKISEASKKNWEILRQRPDYKDWCKKRAESLIGKPKSETHKKLLSEFARTRTKEKNPFFNKHHSEEVKLHLKECRGKKVDMLDVSSGIILKSFVSAKDAGNYLIELGVTSNKYANSRILGVCHGEAVSAYGYTWKFSECND